MRLDSLKATRGTVGVVCAEQIEFETTRNALQLSSESTYCGFSFTCGIVNNIPVVLGHSGIGKVNAAACTATMIFRWTPIAVLVCGVGGALRAEFEIADIVVSSHVIQYDFDLRAFHRLLGEIPLVRELIEPAPLTLLRLREQDPTATTTLDARLTTVDLIRSDPFLLKLAIAAHERMPTANSPSNLHVGIIATGDRFVSKQDNFYREHLNRLRNNLGALCVEMEGAAVGYVCMINGIPFVAIRGICDRANESAVSDFGANLMHAAHAATGLVERMLHSIVESENA